MKAFYGSFNFEDKAVSIYFDFATMYYFEYFSWWRPCGFSFRFFYKPDFSTAPISFRLGDNLFYVVDEELFLKELDSYIYSFEGKIFDVTIPGGRCPILGFSYDSFTIKVKILSIGHYKQFYQCKHFYCYVPLSVRFKIMAGSGVPERFKKFFPVEVGYIDSQPWRYSMLLWLSAEWWHYPYCDCLNALHYYLLGKGSYGFKSSLKNISEVLTGKTSNKLDDLIYNINSSFLIDKIDKFQDLAISLGVDKNKLNDDICHNICEIKKFLLGDI